jgi:hypothetical protein
VPLRGSGVAGAFGDLPNAREPQWERIAGALPGKVGDPGATASDNRLFVEAVLWIARTGAPWRDLPSPEYECKQALAR